MTELAIQQQIATVADLSESTVELKVSITREDKTEHVTIEIAGHQWKRSLKNGMLFVSSLLLTVCKIKNINTNIKIN